MEVLIAMALLFMLSLGMTSLFTNLQKEQKRQSLIALLSSKKANWENLIKNDRSWNNTIEETALNTRLKNCTVTTPGWGGTCADLTVGISYNLDPDNRLVLKDGGSPAQTAYDGRLDDVVSPINNNGFTDQGAACNTFNPAAGSGNDDCPIGYYISWTPEVAELDPRIRVFVKMIYNGSTNNQFNNFFNATATSTTINPKYDVEVQRTVRSSNKSFTVISHIATTAGTCATGGFGVCQAAANAASLYSDLRIRPGENKFNLITVTGTASDTDFGISATGAGTYDCSLTTYAFRAGTVTASVETDEAVSGTFAPVPGGEATSFAGVATAGFATLVANFSMTISNSKRVRIRQVCSSGGSVGADNDCQLGFRASYAGATNPRAVLSCSKLSN